MGAKAGALNSKLRLTNPRVDTERREPKLTWPIQCRTCVAVYQLPLGTDVEIECTAHL
jgi:hypothetical protein